VKPSNIIGIELEYRHLENEDGNLEALAQTLVWVSDTESQKRKQCVHCKHVMELRKNRETLIQFMKTLT
jgi:hypothetical protein